MKLLGRLIDANYVFFIRFHRLSDFLSKGFCCHSSQDKCYLTKGEAKKCVGAQHDRHQRGKFFASGNSFTEGNEADAQEQILNAETWASLFRSEVPAA